MKLNALLPSTILSVALASLSAGASAAYVTLDGWHITTPTTVIGAPGVGRANLVAGSSTIEQQVDSNGQVFTGARFTQNGMIYSVTYTPDSDVGQDFGAPAPLGDVLTLRLNNVVGHVTHLVGSGYAYTFDSGFFTLGGTGGTYINGSVAGLGGSNSNTNIIAGFTGESHLLAAVTSMMASSSFNLFDAGGQSLRDDLLAGQVLLDVVTNHNLTNPIGTRVACSFDATALCQRLNVASAGDAYLVRQTTEVPEPASLALVGLAAGAAALVRRKRPLTSAPAA